MPKELIFMVRIVLDKSAEDTEICKVQDNIVSALESQIQHTESGLAPEDRLTDSVEVVGTGVPFKSTLRYDGSPGQLSCTRTYL